MSPVTCHYHKSLVTWHVTCHISNATCHMELFTTDITHVTFHLSHDKCHCSHVTFHKLLVICHLSHSYVIFHMSRVTRHYHMLALNCSFIKIYFSYYDHLSVFTRVKTRKYLFFLLFVLFLFSYSSFFVLWHLKWRIIFIGIISRTGDTSLANAESAGFRVIN